MNGDRIGSAVSVV